VPDAVQTKRVLGNTQRGAEANERTGNEIKAELAKHGIVVEVLEHTQTQTGIPPKSPAKQALAAIINQGVPLRCGV
jgi:hypothetical protein